MSNEKKHKDMWNWYCYRCKWKGVAQELIMNFDDDGVNVKLWDERYHQSQSVKVKGVK